MILKLIACDVFTREACWCLARSPHVIDVTFTELGEHVHSEALRKTLQGHIDAADSAAKQYDAVLLLFGLCGNATVDLRARSVPLVMPRAHDCCTILLGSKEAFKEHFGDAPSTPFSSTGYMERGEYYLRVEEGETRVYHGDAYAAYVEQYGEENARYIWETLHPALYSETEQRAVFIELPQTVHLGYAEQFREAAQAEGKEFLCLEGHVTLICDLLDGRWEESRFLVVPPGERVVGVYDWEEVVRAKL